MTSCPFPRSRSTNFAMNAATADDTDLSCHPPRGHDERMGRASYAILLDKGMDRPMPESRSRPAWRIGAGSVSHARISSPIDAASILHMTLARCSLTVTLRMRKSKAICLLRRPAPLRAEPRARVPSASQGVQHCAWRPRLPRAVRHPPQRPQIKASSSVWSRTGLVKKSTAPAFIA